MATFTVTTAQNIDALTAKTGADIYNINGGTLTIDQDSRYGLNQTTSTSIDRFVISATLGGTVRIDARMVRLIPFDTGTGTVPASNTVISKGTASGLLIGVYSSLTTAPLAAAAAMPATGYIKIKQWNSISFTAGALTGITANATSADIAGWIEILNEEGTTAQPALAATVPRLGLFEVLGEWYSLGTTSGVAAQTFQIPTNGSLVYVPGVFIEKSVGSNDYEFYPRAGTATAIATDLRAKVCWIATTGIITLGNSGAVAAGYTPASGLKVVIPNIITSHCTSAAKTANVTPNATLTSRFEVGLTTGSGGVYNFDKANIAWYMNFSQCYQVNISNCGIFETVSVSENAAPMTWTKVGIGQSAALTNTALNLSLCFAGGTFTDCMFSRAALATAVFVTTLTDVSDFNFTNCTVISMLVKANVGAASWSLTRANDCTWTNCDIVGAKVLATTCKNNTWTNTRYADVVNGVTATTAAQNNSVWEIQTNCDTHIYNGLTFFGLANVNPFLQILSILAAGCTNIKLRNIGTSPSVSLVMGTTATTYTAYLVNIAAGAAASDIKVQKCFVQNTRTNILTLDNSTTRVTFENSMGDYADVPVIAGLNCIMKGVGTTPTYAAQTAVYGSHWFDHFTSATVGRIAILMNEATSLTSSQITLTGGAAFTSTGGLYMPTIGMTATFEMPYKSLGHLSFQNVAAVMAGGTIGNYTLQYQIDTGSGYGTLKTLSGANLSAETISASLGFKLKIVLTTSTTNVLSITSLYVLTNTSAAAQENYYPMDVNTISFTGLQVGTDVIILSAGTSTILYSKDSITGTTDSYTYSGAQTIDVGFIKQGYVPLYIRNLSLITTDSTLPIAQVVDRNYI